MDIWYNYFMKTLIHKEHLIQDSNLNIDNCFIFGQSRKKILSNLGLPLDYTLENNVLLFKSKLKDYPIQINMEDICHWNIDEKELLEFYGLSNKAFLTYLNIAIHSWSASVLGTPECSIHLKPRFYSNDFDGMPFLVEQLNKGIIPKSSEIVNYKFKNAPLSFILMDMAGVLMMEKNEPLLQELMNIFNFYRHG